MTTPGPDARAPRGFPPVMTVQQAAQRLGVEPAALGGRSGLRTLQVLGDELVLRADLEGWLAGRASPRG